MEHHADKRRTDIPEQREAGTTAYAPDHCNEALRPMNPEEVIDELFKYKYPTPHSGPKYEAIREAARHFARVILMNTPSGNDRQASIGALRMSVMLANAGIANSGLNFNF